MSMPEQTDASKTSCFEESSSPVNAKLVVMKDSCFETKNTKTQNRKKETLFDPNREGNLEMGPRRNQSSNKEQIQRRVPEESSFLRSITISF